MELIKCVCRRCGHSWYPRVPDPQLCPKCKAYSWNEEPKGKKSSRRVMNKEVEDVKKAEN